MLGTSGGLTIDWANMPTYNTVMAVAVGAALLGLVLLGRALRKDPAEVSAEGWSLAFAVLGFILTATGLHMTLTWPLAAGGFPFDNIIFGETSLAFGALLLAASLYLWFRAKDAFAQPEPLAKVFAVARPISIFIFGMGLALIAIAFAGVTFQLFAAPPQEPISGMFAQWPWVEATFMSLLFAIVGVGALAFPFALRSARSRLWTPIGWLWGIAGVVFVLFGAMNFFTHIGLIVHTMG